MSILFKPYHIDAIREGTKTATRRVWAENYNRPKPGRVYMATTELFVSDEACDCYIRVLDVHQEPLGEVDAADARMEGGYQDVDEFREAWEEINGADSWDPEQVVDVVTFEYVGRERPVEVGV